MPVLANLFKDVATAVESNQEFVASTFGPEAVLEVIMELQEECNHHVSRRYRMLFIHSQTHLVTAVASAAALLVCACLTWAFRGCTSTQW